MNLSTAAILLFVAGSAWCKREEVEEDGKKNLRGLLEFDSSSGGSTSTCVHHLRNPCMLNLVMGKEIVTSLQLI